MLWCMGVQKAHDKSCRKRFERIYLHTAAGPTAAASVPAEDEVPDASEAPAGADAEEVAAAGPSGSGVKRRDVDGLDEARSAKRATTTAEDAEMETSERKRKDQALDSPPGLESAAGASSVSAAEPASH